MTNGRERVVGRRVLYLVICAAPPARAIGELIELLQRQGCVVCAIATQRSATWLNTAALAEQTGHPVRDDYKHPDDPDSLPPADAIAVVPATFNTINKWASGISDTFALGILNEAIGLGLPIIAAPYAKPSLAAHPAFGESLRKLDAWRVRVLPNEVIRARPADGAAEAPSGRSTFNWSPVLDAVESVQRWHPARNSDRE